jgi:hypothetical protein
MCRSYESSLIFASLPQRHAGPVARWSGDRRRLAPPASPFRNPPPHSGVAYLDGANMRSYVWTLSKNFTDMPMNAGEWHVWLETAKVGTRGAEWPRGGCAALRNMKRQRVRQRNLRIDTTNTNSSPDQLEVQRGTTRRAPAPVRPRGTRRGQNRAQIQEMLGTRQRVHQLGI